MAFKPYQHRCVVQSGPTAGNKNVVEVSSYDIEHGTECDECRRQLATPEQAIAHVYQQLCEGE